MENKDMLSDLVKKRNEELKKMKELDEKWFMDNIDFETSMNLKKKYDEHKSKYFFYKNLINNLRKENEK